MDLTVLAVPIYFGSIEVERRWLRARSDDPAFDAGQYERRDTLANLAMGTASLLAPMAAAQLRSRLEVGHGRWARPALAAAAGSAAVSLVADRAARRRRSRDAASGAVDDSDTSPIVEERIAGITALAAIAVGGAVATSTWASKLTPRRLWNHRAADLGNGPLPVALAIVGWDFIYYWNHRFMHESRYMWAIHVPHHSSERYNLSVALRQPVADVLGTFVPYGLLCLLGIRPAHIETARGVNLLYQYWIHTESIPEWPIVEGTLNTASAHRVHHGTNPQYIDRNHGSILTIWDRLFGTYEPEDEPVVYGLTTNIESFSPLKIAVQEYASIGRDVIASRTWRDRLSFVFRGPGWAYERHRSTEVPGPAEPLVAA